MCNKRLIFVGDIHGELKTLVWNLVIKNNITDANVIVLGDFGVGFTKQGGMTKLYEEVKSRLEKNDLILWTIRGNHDDPSYFDGKHNYPRLKFIEDWKVLNISGYDILPIGGAVSIDSEWRLAENEKNIAHGSSRRVWWPGEDIQRVKDSELPKKVDIIISHDGPISFNPVSTRGKEADDVWNRSIETRKYLSHVLENVVTSFWYFGHYHRTETGFFGKVCYKCLDIQELFEHTKKED